MEIIQFAKNLPLAFSYFEIQEDQEAVELEGFLGSLHPFVE
jgi:hypothetical protein